MRAARSRPGGLTVNEGSRDYEQTWEEFWVPLVFPNGALDMDKLKRELHDFKTLMDNVSTVYDEVTGGRASKPMTNPRVVMQLAHEEAQRWSDHFCDVGECKCKMSKELPLNGYSE